MGSSSSFLCVFIFLFSLRRGDESASEKANLAVIDFSKYDTEFTALSKDVLQALETYGFLSIANIPNLSTDNLLSMGQTFFEQDIGYKLQYAKCKWNASNPNCYRGYYPIIPGQSSMKEAIEYGRPRNHLPGQRFPDFTLYEQPTYPKVADFGRIFEEHYDVLLETATKMMRLISFALYGNTTERPVEYFEPMFLPHTLSTFRFMHSPPHPLHEASAADSDSPNDRSDGGDLCVTSTPDHADSGFITLVITFQRGLEAFNEKQQRWEQLPVQNAHDIYGNNFVHMNVGRVLRNLTSNQLQATRHRVVNYGEHRYSIAFFFEPNYDTPVQVKPNGGYQNYGDWIVEVDKQFIEYSDEPVGLCWLNRTRSRLQCVDHMRNPISYDHDDGLYEKFIEGNE